MANPDALRAAFDTATTWNEWATGLVVLGLIVEFAALLLFAKEMPPKEKVALVIGSMLVAIGVGGEYIFGGRIAAAARSLQQRSDEKIAALNGQQAADHKIAAQAAKDAATLGVSVGTLHNFVTGKQREIDEQFGQFKAFAADEKKRADAIVADLNRDRTDLNKARDEALAATGKTQSVLGQVNAILDSERGMREKIRRATAERKLTEPQIDAMARDLVRFPVETVQINPTWPSKEILNLSSQLEQVFRKMFAAEKSPPMAGGRLMLMPAVELPEYGDGVFVEYLSGNTKAQQFSQEVARLLNGYGIAAKARPMVCPTCATPNFFPNREDPHWASPEVWVGSAP